MLVSDLIHSRMTLSTGLDNPAHPRFKIPNQEIEKNNENEYTYKSCRATYANPMVKTNFLKP